MSHQSSFLQAFAGYYSLQRKLFSTCKLKSLLKSVPADLRVEFSRQIKIILQPDMSMSKFQTQICQKLIFYPQMSFWWETSAYLIPICKLCLLLIGRLKNFNHQLIQWLKKFLPQLSSYNDDSYLFDIHIVIFLCKYLSQKLKFLDTEQCIWELQAVEWAVEEVGK
ncbi:MAG: hypothetical protein WBA07_04150 [Rivularia sp. (in: cyanobacteria)]